MHDREFAFMAITSDHMRSSRSVLCWVIPSRVLHTFGYFLYSMHMFDRHDMRHVQGQVCQNCSAYNCSGTVDYIVLSFGMRIRSFGWPINALHEHTCRAHFYVSDTVRLITLKIGLPLDTGQKGYFHKSVHVLLPACVRIVHASISLAWASQPCSECVFH